MDKNRFEELVTKKLSEEINSSEIQELEVYLNDKFYRDHFKWIQEKWLQAEPKETFQFNQERGLQLLRDKINHSKEKQIPLQKPKARKLAPWWYAAASVILLFAIGLVFKNELYQIAYQYEIAYNSYDSPLGERTQVILPDSSIVYLQSNSKISIPLNFEDNRSVKLTGEAFFDVVKNDLRPFQIETKNQVTTVLGTSFNIRSNPEHPDRVSVKTGKVNVMVKNSNQEINIIPGQQITVEDNQLNVTSFSNQDELFGWIEGKLVFDKASVNTIKSKIESWYGVKVKLGNLDSTAIQLTGTYHNTSLDDLLKLISYSTDLRYKANDKEVLLFQ